MIFLTVGLLGTGLGTVNANLLTFIWRNLENDGDGTFQEGFGHYTDQ